MVLEGLGFCFIDRNSPTDQLIPFLLSTEKSSLYKCSHYMLPDVLKINKLFFFMFVERLLWEIAHMVRILKQTSSAIIRCQSIWNKH